MCCSSSTSYLSHSCVSMKAHRRLQYVVGHISPSGCSGSDTSKKIEDLRSAEKELKTFIDTTNCNPILVRLAWHDSGTYDQRIKDFPLRGGANGAIQFDPELSFGANAGLSKALGYLRSIHNKYPDISWADLIQLGSATAIEMAGGPKIDMKYGRITAGAKDAVKGESREGFGGNAGLPDALPGDDGKFGCGASSAAEHLRNVFGKKMGFTDQEIVALSGAHTIGRAFKERSGACPFGYSDKHASKYTKSDSVVRADGEEGVGMPGGAAWTKNWLKFDNSYYRDYQSAFDDKDLLWFPTDAALHQDPAFKPHFERYGKDQAAFFADYAKAHKKLSELGSKFEPAEGFKI